MKKVFNIIFKSIFWLVNIIGLVFCSYILYEAFLSGNGPNQVTPVAAIIASLPLLGGWLIVALIAYMPVKMTASTG